MSGVWCAHETKTPRYPICKLSCPASIIAVLSFAPAHRYASIPSPGPSTSPVLWLLSSSLFLSHEKSRLFSWTSSYLTTATQFQVATLTRVVVCYFSFTELPPNFLFAEKTTLHTCALNLRAQAGLSVDTLNCIIVVVFWHDNSYMCMVCECILLPIHALLQPDCSTMASFRIS